MSIHSPLLLLLLGTCLGALYLPNQLSLYDLSIPSRRSVLPRHIVIENDCEDDERECLQAMLSDVMDVFRHAAQAVHPWSRPITEYELGKAYEFFGRTDAQARELVRHIFDEASVALHSFPDGDPRIFCHAERFPENERWCEIGDRFTKLYSRKFLNEIALCPKWYGLAEYTGTDNPNDQITTLMLHLLYLLPYEDHVSKQEWQESWQGFPEWDFYATALIRPKQAREPSSSLRHYQNEAFPRRMDLLYFARSVWRREPVGPNRWHTWAPESWRWMNGTTVDRAP